MKKILLSLVLALSVFGMAKPAFADGCYICGGGEGYVKFSGDDNQDKRKAAAACGCKVSGTRSECNASNLKIMCSVKIDKHESVKLAQATEVPSPKK